MDTRIVDDLDREVVLWFRKYLKPYGRMRRLLSETGIKQANTVKRALKEGNATGPVVEKLNAFHQKQTEAHEKQTAA